MPDSPRKPNYNKILDACDPTIRRMKIELEDPRLRGAPQTPAWVRRMQCEAIFKRSMLPLKPGQLWGVVCGGDWSEPEEVCLFADGRELPQDYRDMKTGFRVVFFRRESALDIGPKLWKWHMVPARTLRTLPGATNRRRGAKP